jgi:hypothetical protein
MNLEHSGRRSYGGEGKKKKENQVITRLGDKKLGDYLEHKGRGKRGEYEIAYVRALR